MPHKSSGDDVRTQRYATCLAITFTVTTSVLLTNGAWADSSVVSGELRSPSTQVSSEFDAKESCVDWDVGRVNRDRCHDFVSGIAIEALDGAARISWTRGSERGVPCYYEYGSPLCAIATQGAIASFDPDSRTGGTTCEPVNADERSCVITGLRNGVQYAFKIFSRIYSEQGVPWTYITPLSRESLSPCCSVPGPPSGVAIAPVGDAIDVSWSQSIDWGGASELDYQVSTTPESSTCEATVLACRLEKVPRGVPVVVSVTASNLAGTSRAATSSVFSIPVTPPAAPSAVSARYPAPGTARVSWTAPSNDGGKPISSYVVTSRPGGKTCTTSGKRTCTIAGLPGGRTYSFTVAAANAVGTSGPSPAGVAGVLVNPASSPRALRAAVSGNSARIMWRRPATLGGGRLIQYVVRAGSSTCTAKTTSCSINGLALGRTYPITVTAVATGGSSKPAAMTITTIAPQPEKPTAILN